MFNVIIVALDGSEHSLKGLDYASDLARKYGSKLILLHAYRSTSDLRGTEEFNQLVAKRKNAGEEIIQAARQRLDGVDLEMEDDLLEGPAANAIIRVAETRKAGLVVVGSRGMGSFKGLIFGSVSTKVTQYAPCPVLVIR